MPEALGRWESHSGAAGMGAGHANAVPQWQLAAAAASGGHSTSQGSVAHQTWVTQPTRNAPGNRCFELLRSYNWNMRSAWQ